MEVRQPEIDGCKSQGRYRRRWSDEGDVKWREMIWISLNIMHHIIIFKFFRKLILLEILDNLGLCWSSRFLPPVLGGPRAGSKMLQSAKDDFWKTVDVSHFPDADSAIPNHRSFHMAVVWSQPLGIQWEWEIHQRWPAISFFLWNFYVGRTWTSPLGGWVWLLNLGNKNPGRSILE